MVNGCLYFNIERRNIMQIVAEIKILPSSCESRIIEDTLSGYISMVNDIVSDFVALDKLVPKTSAHIAKDISSALKAQAIQDARSVYKKYAKDSKAAIRFNEKYPSKKPKTVKVPVLKKLVAIWNNQNFSIEDETISFPLWINGKAKKTSIKAVITDRHRALLQNKWGTLRISKKRGKFMAQIAVDVPCDSAQGSSVMGVDLGLKVPAVAVTDKGRIHFFGNGKQNKYMKRMARAKRKSLGKAKKIKTLKKLNNKEQRWMKDKDHKVSREIVNFAKANGVSVIQLEELSGIRQTARTSRKNAKNLHTWSFYRLAQFIEYKAKLSGIDVVYVNPKYTSQTCPVCGTRNHASDRKYKCPCGFKIHRDILGAMNIITAPVIGANGLSA